MTSAHHLSLLVVLDCFFEKINKKLNFFKIKKKQVLKIINKIINFIYIKN